MKRFLMGLLWLLVFFIVPYVGASLVMAVFLKAKLPPDASPQQASDAMQQFVNAHASAVTLFFWGLILLALVCAILGTWKGKLPGTRQKPAA